MAIHALVYFLSMYGMAWIICYGKISLPIRQYFYNNKDSTPLYFLYELTKCPVCTSWWLALATLLTDIPQYIFNYEYDMMYLFLPFAVSGLTSIIIDLTLEE